MARRSRGRRGPRAADRAGLRAQRADRRRDRGPGRGPRGLAERPGARPGGERPGTPPAHDRPDDLPTAPRELRLGARIHQDALLHELFDLGYVPVSEVAGRGELARRGGIVDVFPPSMALPIRIEFFGDEIDSLRSFDPTDQRTVGTLESAVLLPATEFLLPAGGAAAIRDRLGRAAARLPERLAADLARFDTRRLDASSPRRPRPASRARLSATPRRSGPPTSRRRPASTTSTRARCSSSTSPATSPRRPRSCGARPTSGAPSWSRRASCPRTGRRPTSRRATGRAASSRRGHCELTWESSRPRTSRWPAAGCRRATRSAGASPCCRPVVPGGSTPTVEAWRADGARIVLASDQAPRLADLLGEVRP